LLTIRFDRTIKESIESDQASNEGNANKEPALARSQPEYEKGNDQAGQQQVHR
jgi:hypothetical protein